MILKACFLPFFTILKTIYQCDVFCGTPSHRKISNLIENHIELDDIVIYLKLTTLLYADDTIILAENGDDLKWLLYRLGSFCQY